MKNEARGKHENENRKLLTNCWVQTQRIHATREQSSSQHKETIMQTFHQEHSIHCKQKKSTQRTALGYATGNEHTCHFLPSRFLILVLLTLLALVSLLSPEQRRFQQVIFNHNKDGAIQPKNGIISNKNASTAIVTRTANESSDGIGVKPIRQISILGERNSGTTWIYE